MEALNVNWIERIRKTLQQIREQKDKKDQDRLDRICTMRFALMALGYSLGGWMQWIDNAEVMSTFSGEELEEMSRKIIDVVEKFLEYDIEVTDKGMRRGAEKQRVREQQRDRFVI